MTPKVGDATIRLRSFLFDNVYYNPVAKREEIKAMDMLKRLYEYFVRYPQKMPDIYYKNTESESVERCVCDYLSSMTDRYAIELFKDIFIPSIWQIPGEI